MPSQNDYGAPLLGSEQGRTPGSPLSRLVAGGYPTTSQHSPSAHLPYGDRPSSGGLMSNGTGGSGGGFDAGIAGQWNASVQRDMQHRQGRHDPNISGPAVPLGGQRVTQAPGGASAIDLSWSQGANSPASNSGSSAHHGGPPPRMPGPGHGNAASPVGSSYTQLGGRSPLGSGSQMGNYRHGPTSLADIPLGAGPPSRSAAGQRGASPSHASAAGARSSSVGRSSAPWGRDDYEAAPFQQRQRDAAPFGVDNSPARPPQQQRQRDAAPFVVDCPRGGGLPPAGARGSSRGPGQREGSQLQGGGSPCGSRAYYAAGGGQDPGLVRGRAAGRPPGGGSSLVLG